MTSGEIIGQLMVVCDSPQHARGRTRKMATLTFYGCKDGWRSSR
jgi:hypothetical protein